MADAQTQGNIGRISCPLCDVSLGQYKLREIFAHGISTADSARAGLRAGRPRSQARSQIGPGFPCSREKSRERENCRDAPPGTAGVPPACLCRASSEGVSRMEFRWPGAPEGRAGGTPAVPGTISDRHRFSLQQGKRQGTRKSLGCISPDYGRPARLFVPRHSQRNLCGSGYKAAQRHRFVSVTRADTQSQGKFGVNSTFALPYLKGGAILRDYLRQRRDGSFNTGTAPA